MRNILTLIGIAAVIALFVLFNSAYTVDEREQVIITQWGKPIGDPISSPGLKFKVPFVQKVWRFEKRLIEWDGDPEQIPTLDKKFISVDVTARWRIENPLMFYRSVKDEYGAQSRLDDIIDGATRDQITKLNLIESVKTSNREFRRDEDSFAIMNEPSMEELKVEVGRHEIGVKIKEKCISELAPFGIALVDVRLRRINYVPEVRSKVYERMISERKRMAEFYRSEGLGKKAEIDGTREKELLRITSDAYRQAEEIRGTADAEATKIYADSFGTDPEFYAYIKMLESYKEALQGDVSIIVSTDSFFFSLLKDPGDFEETPEEE